MFHCCYDRKTIPYFLKKEMHRKREIFHQKKKFLFFRAIMAPTMEYAVSLTHPTTTQSQHINNLRLTSVELSSDSFDSFLSLNEPNHHQHGYIGSTYGSDLGQRSTIVAVRLLGC